MKVILLKDIPRIGKKNEVKDVADGFAQNALLPKKLAQIATPQALKALKDKEAQSTKAQTAIIDSTKEAILKLQNQKICVELPANAQGHLFSKFKIDQLKKIFKEKNIDFDPKFIVPFEFKEAGIFPVKIKLPQEYLSASKINKNSPQASDEFMIEIKAI